MPEYLAPGVFIEEIERGPRPIEGVSTSTAAFLGETERGQVTPRLVTSFNEYRRYFGGPFAADRYMPDALSGFFENGGRRAYICRIIAEDAQTASVATGPITFEAVGPGAWGNRLYLKLSADSATKGTDREADSTAFRLQVAYWDSLPQGSDPPDPFADPKGLPRPSLTEDFDNLNWKEPNSPDYWVKRLDGASALIRVRNPEVVLTERPPLGNLTPLADGTPGGVIGVDDFTGRTGDDQRTGLSALELDEFREVALVAAPGVGLPDVNQKMFEHCERNRFRFAVIDSPPSLADIGAFDPRTQWTTQYAAIYLPWIFGTDLRSGMRRLMPPSGHVLGVYARTDIERGVWKAPANEIVRGAIDLRYYIDSGKQEILNPRGVNVIRRFPGRGIRVWGARTLSDNGLWKYVSVRRLFIFLERSIYEGTQWVVFEPNDEKLWERVKDTIRLFLRTQWRNGAMMGLTEDEAFTIACDRSTMTQDDILNGRLVCEIGIAPVRPAEFVIFRIFQNTAEAQN
jgi:phage tail sheath protein FI